MNELINQLCASVSAENVKNLTLELVRIPSLTGDSEAVTACYVERARALGLQVEVVTDFPKSPSTISRYRPPVPGLTLTLDGHLDTIHTPHAAPYIQGNRIYGRGAGDMKSGIAAMLEAVRVLNLHHIALDGNLLLATHTLHEAPVGHMEGLKALLARGDVFIDAALVAEGHNDSVAISGKGQALFEINVTRQGEVLHENTARPLGIPNPLDYAVMLAAKMIEQNRQCEAQIDPLLGPETFFLGQLHGGDFYNRVPTHAFLNGVYRYLPDKNWQDVDAVFADLIASTDRPASLEVSSKVAGNGLGFTIDPDAAIVRALDAAYRAVVGEALPRIGSLSVSDVNVIAREGGIPVVEHGTGSTTAHGDVEWVDVNDIVRAVKVYLATIIEYLGVA